MKTLLLVDHLCGNQLVKMIERKVDIDYFVLMDLVYGTSLQDKYSNIINVIHNFLNEIELYNNLTYNVHQHEGIQHKIKLQDKIKQFALFDLVCFSCYEHLLENQIYIALYLKSLNPSIKILFGGPEIITNKHLHGILRFLNIDYSTGDIDQSVYDFMYNYDSFYKKKHMSFFSNLTVDDYPKYSKNELAFFKDNITIPTSKACSNNCKFCNNPVAQHKESMDKILFAKWIMELNKYNIEEVFLSDANTNYGNFEECLDYLIKHNNKIIFSKNPCFSFDELSINTASKMYKAGFRNVFFGIECMSKENQKRFNKKMPSYDHVYNVVKTLTEHGVGVILSQIYDFPSQTVDSFVEEFRFLKKLEDDFGIKIYFNKYFISRDSYIFNHYKDYNVKLRYIQFPSNPELNYLKNLFQNIVDTETSIVTDCNQEISEIVKRSFTVFLIDKDYR